MALQKFGLVSPTMGIGDSIPNVLLSESYSPDMDDTQNVQVLWGEIRSCKMRKKLLPDNADPIQTLDSNPVLAYHRFIKPTTGEEYFFAFTKFHIFKWSGTAWVYWSPEGAALATAGTIDSDSGSVRITSVGDFTGVVDGEYVYCVFTATYANGFYEITGHTDNTVTIDLTWSTDDPTCDVSESSALSECTTWSVVTFGGSMYATNGIDGMLIGTDVAPFDWMDESADGLTGVLYADGYRTTVCKRFVAFENYLLMLAPTDNSVYCPRRIRWSNLLDASVDDADYTQCGWAIGDADYLELEGSDHIQGAGLHQGYLFIFKNWSFDKMWLSTGDYVFNVSTVSREIGSMAPDSIVNGKLGELYFFASDKTIREIQFGEMSLPIDKTLKQVQDALIPYIQAALIDEYSEIWWSIPYGQDATTNNRVITYHPEKRIWGHRDHGVSAFGKYAVGVDNPTWDEMLGPWDDEHRAWDDTKALEEYPYDICGDYSGYTWLSHENQSRDKTSTVTYKFTVSTNLSQGADIMNYKRITAINIYMGREVGYINFYIKEDNKSWELLTAHPDATSGTITTNFSEAIKCFRLPCDFQGRNFQLKGESPSRAFIFIGAIFEFVTLGMR